MPALTFIVPAFNVQSTLADTLQSLMMQVRPDWCAVVIDDGSTDQTHQVAASFATDPRITVIRQENRGLSGARNRGIAEALRTLREPGTSPAAGAGFLCFLDADDTVEPRFTEAMLHALGDNFDMAACWYRMTGPNLEDLDWIIRTGDHDMAPARLIEYNPYAPGAIVIRRQLIERALIDTSHGQGLFDTSLTVHEDWDAWLRLGAPPPAGAGGRWAPVVCEPLFTYRQRTGSMSGQLERMWRTGIDLIKGAPVDEALKPGALRRWSIRHIARAAARGDHELVAACRSAVDPLADHELEFLAGCLRWSLCQQEQIGPAHVDPDLETAWRSRTAPVLGDLAGRVLARLRFASSSSDAWDSTVEHLRHRIDPGDTLVIYGIGRNGRDLLCALQRAEWPGAIAWIDDNPAATAPGVGGVLAPLPRLEPDDLTPRHFVIITPDEHIGIAAQLNRRGIERMQIGPWCPHVLA